MRPSRWALVVVAVAAVALLVAAELVTRSVLTSAIASSVRERSGAERVDVELHTLSALWSLVTSRFAGVDVDLVGPERNGYQVDEVAFGLQDVTYRAADGKEPSALSGRSGTAVLRLTEAQLNAGLEHNGLPTRVRLVQNGIEVTTDLPRVGRATATASLDVRGGALLLDLSEVSVGDKTVHVPSAIPEIRIPLPSVPPDTRLQAYFVVGGHLEVRVAFGEFHVVEGQFGAAGRHGTARDAASMLADV